MAHSICG